MSLERGFTLIEASVTLAVLALLIALGVPSVSGWLRSTQVRNVAESMQNGLQKARMEALRRNKNVTFWLVSPLSATTLDNTCALSGTAASWVISVENPTSLCATDPSPTVSPMIVEVFNAGPGAGQLVISGLASDGTTPAASVSFNGFGQATSTGTPISRIDVSHSQEGARRLRLAVSSTGSVRMCDRDVVAPDPRACPAP